MTVVVITGASQGIGAAIAKIFAQEKNVHLILLARTETKLQAVAEECQEYGAKVDYFICDVTQAENVQQVADFILLKWGAPTVLVNNAGAFIESNFLDGTYQDFKAQIDVNLIGSFLVSKAFLSAMIERKTGDIFFLASIASLQAYNDCAHYVTVKHGLLGLARSIRSETKGKGIRVTALMPGAVKTPAWDGVDMPEANFMPPEDIGKLILAVHKLDQRTNVEEIILRPQLGDI